MPGAGGSVLFAKLNFLFLTLLITSNFLVACQSPVVAKANGILTIRLKSDPTLINPLSSNPDVQKVTSLLFRGLTRLDESLQVRPSLAEKWTVSDNGQVLLFTLRENLRWHDGKNLTVDDVVFTYRTLMRGDPVTIVQTDVQQVLEDVTAYDDRTVRFALRRPFAPFLTDTTTPILPKHLLEGAIDPAKVAVTVGNGPFALRQGVQKDVLELNAFEESTEKPVLQAVRFVVIPDDANALAAVAKGELDVAEVGISNLGTAPKGVVSFSFPESGFNYVGFNLREGRLFSDKNLRLAWELGIDKSGLVNAATSGSGLPIWSHIPGSSWAYDKSLLPVDRDVVKAKGLLRDAGWQDNDADGVLEKDGKLLSFDLLVRNDKPDRVKAAEYMSGQLKEIGMKATIKPVDFDKELVARRQPPFNFDAMIMGWDLGVDPDDYYLFASGQIPSADRPFLSNYVGFSSRVFDDLSRNARTTYNYQERKRLYDETQQIVRSSLPYYLLWAEQTGVVVSPSVKGPLHPGSPMYLADLEKLWVERN